MGKTIAQLELANREQADFTYSISHDLKSPSNTIGMLIEDLASSKGLGEENQETLADMAEVNQRMRRLVDDVLDYSSIVGQEIATEEVALSGVVEEVRKDLAAEIAETEAVLVVDDLPVIQGQRTQLKILFQNLVSNAVKFRRPDRPPQIEVTASEDARTIAITVADNGIGVPEEYRERVFGLFQRLHDKYEFAGTGLGLAICQRILQKHGGEIRIETGIDGGTAIMLKFPKGG